MRHTRVLHVDRTLMDRYAEMALSVCRAVSLRADRAAPFARSVDFHLLLFSELAVAGGGGGGYRSRSMAASTPTLPIRERGIDNLEQSSGAGGQPCTWEKRARQRQRRQRGRRGRRRCSLNDICFGFWSTIRLGDCESRRTGAAPWGMSNRSRSEETAWARYCI